VAEAWRGSPLRLNFKWIFAVGFSALVGYWIAGRVEDEIRVSEFVAEPFHGVSIATGIIVALVSCGLTIYFWPKPLEKVVTPAPTTQTEPATETESTYPPTRGDAATLGILAGIFSGWASVS
jgi:hypothetical protein